jgi:hypothetical protein
MADETTFYEGGPETFEEYVAEILAKGPTKGEKGMSLLLTCIDYRYPRRILDAMQRLGPVMPYDQFILAGSSLGACRKDWREVLVQHIAGARELGHRIERLVILDHRDCGAYQHPRKLGIPVDALPEGLDPDVRPSVEKKVHETVLAHVLPLLRADFARYKIPNLAIDAWLLTRDQDDKLTVW